ncbi:hypothetical protein [Serratia marcescens]|uniref:hypothetical protein n=1 Tax=Serratia marcescens TaxID=615 RepID=UPI00158E7563
MTYIPLLMKITLDIDQPNRQFVSNTFDISANPVLASALLALRSRPVRRPFFHEFDARHWDNGGVWLRQ